MLSEEKLFDNDTPEENIQHESPEELLATFTENAKKDLAEIDKHIEDRKTFSSLIFYLACQASSSVAAFLLLKFTQDLMIIWLVCYGISLLPVLRSFGDFNINKTSGDLKDGWEISFMSRPIVTVIKTVFGLCVAYVSVRTVEAEIHQTYEQIQQVYDEIKHYEVADKTGGDYSLLMVLGAIGIVFVITLIFRR